MTDRERCFEASFYELRKALFKFCFFEEFNIRNHVASITLGKEKKPLLNPRKSDTVICERFRSAVCS